MDRWTNTKDKAAGYFDSGYNCCEAIVLAVCEELGIEKEMALKVATPFGSGMSRNGSNCGALNAAFISIGAAKGRKTTEDGRDPSYIPSDVVFNKFKEKYGTTFCSEITNINFRDPEEVANNKERLHKELCGPIVKQVAEWVMEELSK